MLDLIESSAALVREGFEASLNQHCTGDVIAPNSSFVTLAGFYARQLL